MANIPPFLLIETIFQMDLFPKCLNVTMVRKHFPLPSISVQVCQQISAGWRAGCWGSTGAASSAWDGTLWPTGEVGQPVGSPAAWSQAATPFGALADAVCFSAAPVIEAAPSPHYPSHTRSLWDSSSYSPRYGCSWLSKTPCYGEQCDLSNSLLFPWKEREENPQDTSSEPNESWQTAQMNFYVYSFLKNSQLSVTLF